MTGPADEKRLARLRAIQTRLAAGEGYLSRTDLAELGLERRGVDAVFRAVPTIVIPGYSRPLVLVADYLRCLEGWTYRDDRVRAA